MGRTGTNRHAHKGKGYPFLTASVHKDGVDFLEGEHFNGPVDKDKTVAAFRNLCSASRVDFDDLPVKVRQEVRNMYIKLWKIT
jgi:hypothetical protein